MGGILTRLRIWMRFCDDRENNSDELIYAGTVIIMQRVNNARMQWRKTWTSESGPWMGRELVHSHGVYYTAIRERERLYFAFDF